MNYSPLGPIPLTDRAKALLSEIDFELDGLGHDATVRMLESAHDLAESLIDREAIPRARIDYFVLPELNIGSSLSRKGVFESNGTSSDDILRHGNFLDYLRYFIHGPRLPESTVRGFCKILNDDAGTSGTVLDQMRKFVRAEVRGRKLDPRKAADEFFKLSHEIGLDSHRCRAAYDAARTTR